MLNIKRRWIQMQYAIYVYVSYTHRHCRGPHVLLYITFCCHLTFKHRWRWDEISFTHTHHWFLTMLHTKGPWLIPEMSGCDKTAPQITDICAKQEKVYLRKCNHHKANEPFRPHSALSRRSQVQMYWRCLEQVLFVNASKITAMCVLCAQWKGLQVC